MAQVTSFVSDLTGAKIADDSEHASIIVLSHPTIDEPVRLDAHVLEAANLKDESTDLVQVEVHLPTFDAEKLWIPLTKFDKLFGKDIDAQQVLESAEPAQEAQVTPRRRGRPAGSTNKRTAARAGRTPEELQAIRTWARGQGMEVADRGRISAKIVEQFDAAHA